MPVMLTNDSDLGSSWLCFRRGWWRWQCRHQNPSWLLPRWTAQSLQVCCASMVRTRPFQKLMQRHSFGLLTRLYTQHWCIFIENHTPCIDQLEVSRFLNNLMLIPDYFSHCESSLSEKYLFNLLKRIPSPKNCTSKAPLSASKKWK